jgi:hypothetical protein
MNIQQYAKKDIALQQIETALELFSRQEGDLFSVITLAGAAEEILGQLLRQQAGSQGLSGAVTSLLQILRPGGPKGGKKEGLSGHELAGSVHMDARHEAVFLLGRAIEDYVALTGTPSAAMLKFMSEVALKQG